MMRIETDRPAADAHAERWTAAALLAVFGAAFVYLVAKLSQRSLWGDENMAMVNYPLHDLLGLFQPLPFYSQAAPPVFNLIMNSLSPLPFEAVRAITAAAIVLLSLVSVQATFKSLFVTSTVFGLMVGTAQFLIMATELKYYALEVPGALIALTWVVRKHRAEPLSWRDAAWLCLSASLGISTIVIAFCCLAFATAERFDRIKFLKRNEYYFIAAVTIFLIGYYLLIRYETSIQILSFPAAYERQGPRTVWRVWEGVASTSSFPGLVLVALAATTGLAHPGSRRLTLRVILLCALIAAAFSVLALLGKYPATSKRHVTWSFALSVIVFAASLNGVVRTRRPGKGVLLASCALLVLYDVRAVRHLATTNVEITDNRSILAWLEQTPAADIGVWFGGQPLVENAIRRDEFAIRHHRYFGIFNSASYPLEPRYTTDGFLKAAYDRVGGEVEGRRHEAGAFIRLEVYRLLNDFRAPANSLLDEAPPHRPFYILASHVDWQDRTYRKARFDGLIDALEARNCKFEPAVIAKNAFVLAVNCG